MAFHKRQNPTRFPYITEARLFTGVSTISFPISFATDEAFTAFKMNAKNLDAIALRDVAKERREAGVTIDDVKATLKEGAEFIAKVELEHDTDAEVACVRCLKSFQPVRKPRTNGGFSGNFRTLKADEVAKLDEVRQRIATVITAWALGVEALPADLKTRAVPVCTECKRHETESLVREKTRLEREGSDRKPFFPPYLVAGDVQDALYARDSAITNAINRKAYDQVVSGNRGDRRPATDNRGAGNGRGDRPRGPRKAWHGAELFPNVADTLIRLVAEGKLGDSIEALLAMAPTELEALGVQNAPKVQQLAQSHSDWVAREARKNDFAHTGRVKLGEATVARR